MRLLFGFIFMIFTSTLNSQTIIRMQQIGGVSTIPCKINGLPLNFIFDTGASEVSLSLTEVSFMLKNGYLKKEDFIGTSNYLDANGEIREGLKVIIKKIEIGNLFISDVTANIVKNLKAPILLGQSALRKFGKFQVDFDENTIIFLTKDTIEYSDKYKIDSAKEIAISKDEDLYNIADKKYDSGDYIEAINIISKAININNKVEKYYLLRALALENLKDYKSAIKDYDKCIEINPKNSTIFGFKGQILYELNDTSGALFNLTNAIKFDSTNSYAYRIRGGIKFDKKLFSLAIHDLNKAILYDSLNCFNFRLRGASQLKIKKYKEAINDFNKAIKICDDDAYSYIGRSAVNIELKKYESALDDLDVAEKIDSTISQVYSQKAKIASLQNKKELAITYYEKALSMDSTDFFSDIQLHFLKEEVKNDAWSYLFSTDDDDEYYMKKSTESNENDIIQIWLKVKHKKITIGKQGKKMTYLNAHSSYLAEFNCASKRMRFIYTVTYDSKNKVITKNEDEYSDFGVIAPGTIGELLLQKVCKEYN